MLRRISPLRGVRLTSGVEGASGLMAVRALYPSLAPTAGCQQLSMAGKSGKSAEEKVKGLTIAAHIRNPFAIQVEFLLWTFLHDVKDGITRLGQMVRGLNL